MAASKFGQFLATAGLILFMNAIFAMFLYAWITEDDFKGLPSEPTDRFYALFYFASITFTTTGYGDIVPVSRRARMVSALYIIFIASGLLALVTHVFK